MRAKSYQAWLNLLVVFLAAAPAFAQGPQPRVPQKQQPKPAKPAPVAAPPHALAKDDVETFFDGLVPFQLAREDIAGVVIAIVKDGQIFFAKGYGYSDVEKRTPVSVDNTLFRPGSISKLFTWTAVMQQVERGKLDLDRDVNNYLDFKIPATFPKPITMRDLMTHTPGFEESIQELFVENAKELTPLDDYLKAHLPARIFPPWTTPAYSNYGATLAGYIVQRLSGQPFDDYIEQHIFKPLGMAHSTFRQPLPDSLAPLMSKGYTVASQPAKPFEFVEAAPAGSSSVTAADISRFMIAHLQDGAFQGTRILNSATARLMHSRQFGELPDMNGMALGFYEESRNGHRIIGHGGDTGYFHSDLHLLADANLGFFISYNSAGKGETDARTAVWSAFLNRYFPYQPPAAAPVASAAHDAASVGGRYISSRRSQTTVLKFLTVTSELEVFSNSDGTISVNDLKQLNGEPIKFREISPLLFRDVNGQSKIAFKHDYSGRLILITDFPVFVFQKAPLNENSSLDLPLIIAAVVVLALSLLLWPLEALIRKHYKQTLTLTPKQRRLRLLVRIVAALDLIFLAAFVAFFTVSEITLLTTRFNPLLWVIEIVGYLGVVGTVVVLYNAIESWRIPQHWIWAKLGDILVALACIVFVWFVFTWNMVHWSIKY